jgi:hypothetical protein
VHGVCEALALSKRKTVLVDVDCAHAACAEGLCECAREQADRTNTKDEDRLAGDEARTARGVQQNGERLGEGSLVVRAAIGERVEHVCGMVHAVLQRAVEVRECLGGGAEAELFAEVVAAARAELARVAHDAGLDCDTLANEAIANARPHCSDYPRRLVTEHEGGLECKIAVPPVCVVVY